MLKAELRNMERSQKREGVDLTYLKNVILKLLETGTHVGRSITKRELFFSPFVDWSIKVQGMFQTRWFWLPCWIFTEQVKWRYYCLLLQCFCNSVLKRWNSCWNLVFLVSCSKWSSGLHLGITMNRIKILHFFDIFERAHVLGIMRCTRLQWPFDDCSKFIALIECAIGGSQS